jgi:hypothetical protein
MYKLYENTLMYFFIFSHIITGGIALKKKVKNLRQNKLSTTLLNLSEIKSEPIDVIEILDD